MRLALVLLGRATMRAALPRLIDRRGCGTVERARVTTASTDPTTRHARARQRLLAQYAAIPAGDPVRLAKHTSNLFRPRTKVSRPGLDVSDHARHELTVRNREAPLAIFVVPSAGRLAERLTVGGDRVGA